MQNAPGSRSLYEFTAAIIQENNLPRQPPSNKTITKNMYIRQTETRTKTIQQGGIHKGNTNYGSKEKKNNTQKTQNPKQKAQEELDTAAAKPKRQSKR